MVRLIGIAAVSENGVIGRNQSIPWKEQADMEFFRDQTMNHPVIMGRRTYESLPGELDGRMTVVLSESSNYGDVKVTSIKEALSVVEDFNKAFVAGGESIFVQMLGYCHTLLLTRIPGEYKGNAKFPEYPPEEYDWSLYDERSIGAVKFQEWR